MTYWPHRNDIDQEAARDLSQACQEALGDQAERSLQSPQYVPAYRNNPESWVGGVEFERNAHAIPIVKGSCCYTVGLSHQCPRKLTSPVAAAKMHPQQGENMDSNQCNRYAIAKVSYYYLVEPS
jgi:hypothetical protein